jgi:hypothetical protein
VWRSVGSGSTCRLGRGLQACERLSKTSVRFYVHLWTCPHFGIAAGSGICHVRYSRLWIRLAAAGRSIERGGRSWFIGGVFVLLLFYCLMFVGPGGLVART